MGETNELPDNINNISLNGKIKAKVIDAKGVPTDKDELKTINLWHEAIGHKKIDVLEKIFQYIPVDLNEKDKNGQTLLHTTNSKEVAAFFINNKANIDEPDNAGRTPLHE